MIVGRNDPCPCGSGKKFKKCCMHKAALDNAISLMQTKIRRSEGQLIYAMQVWLEKASLDHLANKGLEDFLRLAKQEFSEEQFNALEDSMLWYFVLLDWLLPASKKDKGITLAQLFAHDTKPTGFDLQVLTQMQDQPYSFYQIEDVIPGKGLYLKDLLLDTTTYVHERLGSVMEAKGMIQLSKVITLNNTSVMIGAVPLPLEGHFVPQILAYQDTLRQLHLLHPEGLRQAKTAIIRLFWDMYREASRPPVMTNNDGDIIEWNQLVYTFQMDMPSLAQRLLPLTPYQDMAEFLQVAAKFTGDQLVSLSFPRVNEQHVVIGEFQVSAGELRVTTNSAKRSGRIKSSITRRLGEQLQLVEQIWDPQLFADKIQQNTPVQTSSAHKALDDETHSLIAQYMQTHWKSWIDQSLPALNHQTPRQACKTPQGRKLVESLLLSFEGRAQQDHNDPSNPPIDWLRQQLKLE